MTLKRFKSVGPGAMVAAAFIGPGTVTTATIAGASYGYTLLWAIVFSTIATIVLQEMTARLGCVAQMGVGEALRTKVRSKLLFYFVAFLVIGAIFIGNAAYEAGNISGAALGLYSFLDEREKHIFILLIGLIAFLILNSGVYKLIERFLVFLVVILAIVFILTAIVVQPDFISVIKGLLIPSIPDQSLLLVVGLIGTTVVPYNLFLHASASRKNWSNQNQLNDARWDTFISVALGGVITLCILITATASFSNRNTDQFNAGDLVHTLQPLLGDYSVIFISFGFLAAGLSSAVTAPLATAFAISELLGFKTDMKSGQFKIIWIIILIIGIVFSLFALKPVSVILFAQFANGLLLPIIASFLLWIMNDKTFLGKHINGLWSNLSGLLVVVITVILGLKSITTALNQLW